MAVGYKYWLNNTGNRRGGCCAFWISGCFSSMIETGRPLNGKKVVLDQLEREIEATGIQIPTGISEANDAVWLVNPQGMLRDFPPSQRPTVDACIAAHVPATPKDYAAEYQNPATTLERKV